MKTIKLPRNLKCLRKWLPKPNYELGSSSEQQKSRNEIIMGEKYTYKSKNEK